VDWTKVDSNDAIRDSSTPDKLELTALNVGSLYKGLDKGQFGHSPAMASYMQSHCVNGVCLAQI
jgi:hypothetical protein